MRFKITFLILAVLLLMVNFSFSFAENTDVNVIADNLDQIKVGAAMLEITPTNSVVLGGYGMYVGSRSNCRWSDGIHDPLYATAISFSKNNQTVIIIEMDSVGLLAFDIDFIRKKGALRLDIPFDNIIVAASHSHATPDTIGFWGTMIPSFSGRNEKYMTFIKEQAVAAAVDAYKSRKAVSLHFAVGEEKELHFNTYSEQIENPYIDDTLTVVKAVDKDGKLVATITNWGCHPTTENGENRKISADWVGPFRQHLSDNLGGVHMFINGSIGAAIQPSVPWREKNVVGDGQGFVWADAMGKTLAQKVLALLKEASPLDIKEIEVASRPVKVRMKNFAFWLAKSSGQVRLGLPPYGAPVTTHITALKMGDLRFGSVPGELSPQIGIKIREHLGGKAQILVGLGQDWLGYILDEEQYNNKMYMYEKFLCLSPKLGEKVLEAFDSIEFH